MFNLIATILAWFYSLTHNYALAIAMLTLTVMVLLTPLTLKGTKSMIQMQRLQPEIKKIQTEFKADRQRLNEELMKFYQENKINPVGGCLPLLIQAPVFGVLYRVVHKLTEACTADNIASALAKKAGRCYSADPRFPIKADTFGPSYIRKTTDLWQALAGKTKMVSFGIDLGQSTIKQIQQSFVEAIPFMVLILLVGFTSWYQQRQIMARQKGQPSSVPAQQQAIMKFLPFMWPIFLLFLPTGLAVYALVSNLYRIGQQSFITRTMYHKGDDGGFQPAAPGKPRPDRPGSSAKSEGPVVPPKAKNRPAPTRSGASAPAAKAAPVKAPSKGSPTTRPTPKPKPKPSDGGGIGRRST
jgi:YidC/Oxa1 family membrane protein insertase